MARDNLGARCTRPVHAFVAGPLQEGGCHDAAGVRQCALVLPYRGGQKSNLTQQESLGRRGMGHAKRSCEKKASVPTIRRTGPSWRQQYGFEPRLISLCCECNIHGGFQLHLES